MSRNRADDPRQMQLFGDGAPPPDAPAAADVRASKPRSGASADRSPGIESAPPRAEWSELARGLPANLYFGTSSWSFPGWAGLVYAGRASSQALSRGGLTAYARHPLLRAVGIDRTYYAPVGADELKAYASQVPESFLFLVKAPEILLAARLGPDGRVSRRRGAAANRYFLNSDHAAAVFVEPVLCGLGENCGPLVFQFPPLSVRAEGGVAAIHDRLHSFLKALPRGPLYAVELRNEELLVPEYAALLADAGVAHCFNAHPAMPAIAQQRAVVDPTRGPAIVVRWMLHRRFSYEGAKTAYEPFDKLVDEDLATRAAVAELCADAIRARLRLLMIANNKAEGSAPWTVVRLAEHVLRTPPEGS